MGNATDLKLQGQLEGLNYGQLVTLPDEPYGSTWYAGMYLTFLNKIALQQKNRKKRSS